MNAKKLIGKLLNDSEFKKRVKRDIKKTLKSPVKELGKAIKHVRKAKRG